MDVMEPETLPAKPTLVPLPAVAAEAPAVRGAPRLGPSGEDFEDEIGRRRVAAGVGEPFRAVRLAVRVFPRTPVPRRHGGHFRRAVAAGCAAGGQPAAGAGVRAGVLLLPVRRTLPRPARAGHRPLAQQLRHAQRNARKRQAGQRALRAVRRAAPRAGERIGGLGLLAARLFTILPQREEAMAEMHRVLRAGGRCFIAEPCSRLRAVMPLRIMWGVANLLALCGYSRTRAYREPPDATVLAPADVRCRWCTRSPGARCGAGRTRIINTRSARRDRWIRQDPAADPGRGGRLRDLRGPTCGRCGRAGPYQRRTLRPIP